LSANILFVFQISTAGAIWGVMATGMWFRPIWIVLLLKGCVLRIVCPTRRFVFRRAAACWRAAIRWTTERLRMICLCARMLKVLRMGWKRRD